MNKTIFLLVALAFIFGSCNSNKKAGESNKNVETEQLTVASAQGDCVGVAPMKCLLVKKDGQTDWEFFYNQIEGFNYEPGYEYVVEVRTEKIENPAADQSSLKYTLVNVVSKTEKTSENLPPVNATEDRME